MGRRRTFQSEVDGEGGRKIIHHIYRIKLAKYSVIQYNETIKCSLKKFLFMMTEYFTNLIIYYKGLFGYDVARC